MIDRKIALLILMAACSPAMAQSNPGTISISFRRPEQAVGTDRAALATLKTSCVEDVMPNSSSGQYTDSLKTVSSHMLAGCEDYQYAWEYVRAVPSRTIKTQEIYAASRKYDIPPMVLLGSIAQESSLYEMGISKDFFNFACGLAQLNVNDWCEWASHADAQTQASIGWPTADIAEYHRKNPGMNVCSTFFITPQFIRPQYEFGMRNLRRDVGPQTPEYMLETRHVTQRGAPTFESALPLLDSMAADDFYYRPSARTLDEQKLRYELAQSFTGHCSDPRLGIDAGAFTFRMAFDSLPIEIRSAQRYRQGDSRAAACRSATQSSYFPVAIGWLIADAVYNAGPELLPGIMEYQMRSRIAWDEFSPANLIDAINFTLAKPNTGLAPIGRVEAVGHVSGVLEAIGATVPVANANDETVVIPIPPSVSESEVVAPTQCHL